MPGCGCVRLIWCGVLGLFGACVFVWLIVVLVCAGRGCLVEGWWFCCLVLVVCLVVLLVDLGVLLAAGEFGVFNSVGVFISLKLK